MLPLAATDATKAPGDPRPSLAALYLTPDSYATKVKAAAERLVAERFLLPDDAARFAADAREGRSPDALASSISRRNASIFAGPAFATGAGVTGDGGFGVAGLPSNADDQHPVLRTRHDERALRPATQPRTMRSLAGGTTAARLPGPVILME